MIPSTQLKSYKSYLKDYSEETGRHPKSRELAQAIKSVLVRMTVSRLESIADLSAYCDHFSPKTSRQDLMALSKSLTISAT
jgi:hypothetical protein